MDEDRKAKGRRGKKKRRSSKRSRETDEKERSFSLLHDRLAQASSTGTATEQRQKRKSALKQHLSHTRKRKKPTSMTTSIMPPSLVSAIQSGDLKSLSSNKHYTSFITTEGYTVLHLAAIWSQDSIVEYFLQICNSSINDIIDLCANTTGNTALHYACLARNSRIVDALIEAGASLVISNCVGETPVDLNATALHAVGKRDRLIREAQRAKESIRGIKPALLDEDSKWTSKSKRVQARREYLEAWSKLREKASPLSYDDIPWPPGPSYDIFLLQDEGCSNNTIIREEQKRWHPDKFQQYFGQKLYVNDVTRILEKVNECSQLANALTKQ